MQAESRRDGHGRDPSSQQSAQHAADLQPLASAQLATDAMPGVTPTEVSKFVNNLSRPIWCSSSSSNTACPCAHFTIYEINFTFIYIHAHMQYTVIKHASAFPASYVLSLTS